MGVRAIPCSAPAPAEPPAAARNPLKPPRRPRRFANSPAPRAPRRAGFFLRRRLHWPFTASSPPVTRIAGNSPLGDQSHDKEGTTNAGGPGDADQVFQVVRPLDGAGA